MAPLAFASLLLHVRTLNARGLNVPERRSRLLRELWSFQTSVAMIQETYFKLGSETALKDRRFPTGYFTSHSSLDTLCIKKALRTLHLVDCWRTLHPETRDYSYYSAVHGSYTRIDYLFLSQTYLTLLQDSTIGHIAWSDHAPVSLPPFQTKGVNMASERVITDGRQSPDHGSSNLD
ncbi:Hypothetical predicted protein [Pelobates cultripes]|uniref:Endonuclease/exonuclease/phosphatase domain-containing protein n=1 Tax=Pelobates cultripes TaxID=61616 RepID=A0AAD1S0Z3_PELCU|nr:Hypothetical predicted protein [Pelobates cultripes]CAH2285497.1 Hypothetical predicted protein [Pelobates cultripes]